MNHNISLEDFVRTRCKEYVYDLPIYIRRWIKENYPDVYLKADRSVLEHLINTRVKELLN